MQLLGYPVVFTDGDGVCRGVKRVGKARPVIELGRFNDYRVVKWYHASKPDAVVLRLARLANRVEDMEVVAAMIEVMDAIESDRLRMVMHKLYSGPKHGLEK